MMNVAETVATQIWTELCGPLAEWIEGRTSQMAGLPGCHRVAKHNKEHAIQLMAQIIAAALPPAPDGIPADQVDITLAAARQFVQDQTQLAARKIFQEQAESEAGR